MDRGWNDHGEGLQTVMGVFIILSGIVGIITVLICLKHLGIAANQARRNRRARTL
jgi:hypothetical protein